MNTQFTIQSSDPLLFEKANRIARDFARQFINEEIVGIIFLGAVVRGYFDPSADIDVAIFKEKSSIISLPSQYLKVEGLEVHCHLSDYEEEIASSWDMAKRWTFSQGLVFYDPKGKLSKLLKRKVPLQKEERKWLLMSGLSLSEWYINRLTRLWIERGSLVSAHHMFSQGLNYFLEMLFGLNNQLVADMKWRYYCAERLERLPSNFQEHVKAILTLRAVTTDELERRRAVFMEMWQEMKPVIEQEVHLSYEEINQLV